jgi:hypothetical protein
MKKDFTSPIIETIRKQSEFTKKAEIDNDRLKYFERVLNLINNCHYKELDGLSIGGIGVANEKATISLTNRESNYYVEFGGYKVELSDLDRKVKMIFKIGRYNELIYNIYFPCGNDIIRIIKDDNNYVTLGVYTDILDERKNIDDYIPDFTDRLELTSRYPKKYRDTEYVCNLVVSDEWTLDHLRTIALQYYKYVHRILDTLDCDIQKSR